jgi:hypothetical protein
MSVNGDILEELRTITRLPLSDISRTSSPGINRSFGALGVSSDVNGMGLQLKTPPLGSENTWRKLSDLSGKSSPVDGWKRPFPSPISRKTMRNPILFNDAFEQE